MGIHNDLHVYMLFFYNMGQMNIPNPKIFGRDMITLRLPPEALSADNGSYHIFTQDFQVTQTHWRALDHDKLRCDDKHSSMQRNINTSACITEFLENESNCSMALRGSKSNNIR